MASMIEVRDLQRSFGTLKAVGGISFAVERGETLGLLGPNGAGKSTTIHMVSGVLGADGGEILLNGQADPLRPKVRAQLGYAPQEIALYQRLTARENIAFFGKMQGLRSAGLSERTQWALDLAGLSDRAAEPISNYSGGMLRRLNLVTALVHEPQILLLDEPTAGVDPQSRNHLFDRIETLQREGLTILYTTHHMEEAARLCDRVAIMDHGKLLDCDTVDRLIDRHGGEARVEAEFASPPVDPSSLPGEIEDQRFHARTSQPLETVAKLASAGVEIRSLNIHRPTLEDVFLNLTGRSLRD